MQQSLWTHFRNSVLPDSLGADSPKSGTSFSSKFFAPLSFASFVSPLMRQHLLHSQSSKSPKALCICLVSVQSFDFQMPFHGHQFKTHKWKFGSELQCEVVLSILNGDCVWTNGPCQPRIWNDITIFQTSQAHLLLEHRV